MYVSVFILFSFEGMSQDFSDPVVYNNFVINEQNALINRGLDYIAFSIHSSDLKAIEKKRLETIQEIRKSMGKIRRLPLFEGSARLKNQTINVFSMYLKTYETDILYTLSLKRKYDNSYEALAAYFKSEKEVEDKMSKAIAKLSRAQEAFARRNGIVFDEAPTGAIESRAGLVNNLSEYSRGLFLEYFVVSRAFNDMVAVLSERDGQILDKKRKVVIKKAESALERLNMAQPFNNNSEYLDQTIDIIQYFNGLCKKEFRQIVKLYNKPSLTENEATFINKTFNDYNANIETLVYNWTLANKYLWSNNVGVSQ